MIHGDRGTVVQSQLSQLIDERSWPAVLKRIFSYKEEASLVVHRGFDDSLALHEACKLQPPVDVVEALIEAYEPAVRTKGQWGYLPLHFACKSGASPVVVSTLMRRYPAGTRSREDSGKLPLHIACQWGAEAAVVEKILTNHPEGIYVRDDDGKTGLDYAKNTFSSHKEEVLAVLAKATEYCVVSKCAVVRANEEFESKLRGKLEAYLAHLAKVEKKHRGEIDSHVQALASLRSELTKSTAESQSLSTQLEKSKKDNSDLRSELDAEISRTKSLMEDIAMIKKTNSETVTGLQSEVSQASKQIQFLNSELETRNKEYYEVRSELDTEVSRTRSLMEDVAAVKKTAVDDKKELMKDLEQKKSDMKQEFENQVRQARDSFQHSVSVMRQKHQKEIEKREGVEQELRTGLESMKNQVDLLVGTLKESRDKMQAERDEIGKARQELENMLQEEKNRAEQLESNLRDMIESSKKQSDDFDQHMRVASELHREKVTALLTKHEEEVNHLREASVAEKAAHQEEFNLLMKKAAEEHNTSVSQLQSRHEQEVKKCARVENELRLGLEQVRSNMVKLNTDIIEFDALPSAEGERPKRDSEDTGMATGEDDDMEVEELSNAKKTVSNVALEAERLQSTIASAKQVAFNLQSQIEQKQIAEDMLRTRIGELEDLADKLRNELVDTTEQRDAVNKDKEELEFKLLKSTRQCTSYVERIHILKRKLQTLSETMQSLAIQQDANSASLLEQEQTIRLMKSQNDDAKEKLRMLVSTAAELDGIAQCREDESLDDDVDETVQYRVVAEVSFDEEEAEDGVRVSVDGEKKEIDVKGDEDQGQTEMLSQIERETAAINVEGSDAVSEAYVLQAEQENYLEHGEKQENSCGLAPEPSTVNAAMVEDAEAVKLENAEVTSIHVIEMETAEDSVEIGVINVPEDIKAPNSSTVVRNAEENNDGEMRQAANAEAEEDGIEVQAFSAGGDCVAVSGAPREECSVQSDVKLDATTVEKVTEEKAEFFEVSETLVRNGPEEEVPEDEKDVVENISEPEKEMPKDEKSPSEKEMAEKVLDEKVPGEHVLQEDESVSVEDLPRDENVPDVDVLQDVGKMLDKEVPEDKQNGISMDKEELSNDARMANDVCVGEAPDEVEVIVGNDSGESSVPKSEESAQGSRTVMEEDVPDDEKQVDAKNNP